MFTCKYCGSERPSNKSLIAHEATCPSNPNGYRNVPWNKGQSKDNNEKIRSYSEKMTGKKRPEHSLKLKEKVAGENNPFYGKKHSEDSKQKMSEKAKLNEHGNYGRYIKGSGRGKKGWYKGYWCDSSWELALVIYCLENNITIERNYETYDYVYNGINHKYHPDFLVDGELVEVKGYWTEQTTAKINQCPKQIRILDKATIKPYIEYAVFQYGKDFIRLYGE